MFVTTETTSGNKDGCLRQTDRQTLIKAARSLVQPSPLCGPSVLYSEYCSSRLIKERLKDFSLLRPGDTRCLFRCLLSTRLFPFSVAKRRDNKFSANPSVPLSSSLSISLSQFLSLGLIITGNRITMIRECQCLEVQR